jgi:hypothetical protein
MMAGSVTALRCSRWDGLPWRVRENMGHGCQRAWAVDAPTMAPLNKSLEESDGER